MTETLLEVDQAGSCRRGEGLAGVAQVVEGDRYADPLASPDERLVDRVRPRAVAIAVPEEELRSGELLDVGAEDGDDVRRNRHGALAGVALWDPSRIESVPRGARPSSC